MATVIFGERYLRTPDLLAQAWPAAGSEQLCIDFVGGPYLFLGLSRTQFDVLRSRYEDLCLDPRHATHPTVLIDVCRADRQSFRSDWTFGEVYGQDMVYAPRQIDVAGRFFCGRLHLDTAFHGKFVTHLDSGDYLLGAFENFFRGMVAYRLLQSGGVLLHSAAIVDGDRASIYFGVSGAGKSTISAKALSEGFIVLSDDLNALVPVEGRVTVCAVPFTGELGRGRIKARQYEVNGVYRLHHGESCCLTPFRRSRFLASALVCAPFVNANRYASDRLEANLLQLSSAVPTGALLTQAQTRYRQVLECIGVSQRDASGG